MAGQDLYHVKCNERFIRRIKWCKHWVVLAALLTLGYSVGLKAFCLMIWAIFAMIWEQEV